MSIHYVPPKDFQIPGSIRVEGNKLIIKPTEGLKYNSTYSIVVRENVRAIDGSMIGTAQVVEFSSVFSPAYADPLEVQGELRNFATSFTMIQLYTAIRNASQKAHQLLGLIPDANQSRFKLILEREDTYFPATKFVVYEAARTLLSSLLLRLAEGQGMTTPTPGGDQTTTTVGMKVTLGDFTIEDKSGTSTGTTPGGTAAKDQPDPVIVIKAILREIDGELKFWKDSMMGRNARGYARPISAITRSGVPAPTDRGLE